jgi:hypothetical protein
MYGTNRGCNKEKTKRMTKRIEMGGGKRAKKKKMGGGEDKGQ